MRASSVTGLSLRIGVFDDGADDDSVNDVIALGGGSGGWKCGICCKVFSEAHAVQDHVQAHRSLTGYGLTCLMCGLTYEDRYSFSLHMTTNHKNSKQGLIM